MPGSPAMRRHVATSTTGARAATAVDADARRAPARLPLIVKRRLAAERRRPTPAEASGTCPACACMGTRRLACSGPIAVGLSSTDARLRVRPVATSMRPAPPPPSPNIHPCFGHRTRRPMRRAAARAMPTKPQHDHSLLGDGGPSPSCSTRSGEPHAQQQARYRRCCRHRSRCPHRERGQPCRVPSPAPRPQIPQPRAARPPASRAGTPTPR